MTTQIQNQHKIDLHHDRSNKQSNGLIVDIQFRENNGSTNQQVVTNSGEKQPEFVQYCYRWVIIALTLFAVIVNGLANNNVGPVASKISKVYQINTFYTVAPITVSFLVYALMNFPANYLIDVFGLRFSFIVGTLFYALGQLMFVFIEYGYFFAIIGAIIISIGQPFIINCPAKIATFWFMNHNRTMAVALITVFQLIGAAVGFLFPATFISEDSRGDVAKRQFFMLYIIQFGVGGLCFILVLIFMRSQPPTPPSVGASTQKISLKQSFILIKNQPNLWVFIFGYMIIAGAIMSFSSNANLLLNPYGYTNLQIALLAIILLFCGVAGAIVVSFIVKKTLRYGLVIRTIPLATVILIGLLIITLNFVNYLAAVIVLGIFLGFAITPIVPIAYDLMCELGFPIGQAQAVGILNGVAMIWTFIFTNIITLAMGLQKKRDTMVMLGCIGAMQIIGLICFFFVSINLKRHQAEVIGKSIAENLNKTQQHIAIQANKNGVEIQLQVTDQNHPNQHIHTTITVHKKPQHEQKNLQN